MSINKEKLAAIISGKARNLCSPQGDRLINEYSSNRKNLIDPNPDSFDDSSYFDSMYLSESNQSNDDMLDYDVSNIENSKLPPHIKESLKQKIEVSGNVSVLDELGVKPQQKRQIREQKILTHTPQVTSSVDYTIIKAIVNECLKEFFDKQTLNESASLKTIGLQNGNISLVDNKGNIYKAKLEKIGNKNKQ
jgi:hypothetical protein